MSQIDRSLAEAARAWPFEEARKLVARTGGKVPAKGYVLFETGYGPSGLPHIGTFGEVVRTTMVRQAFQRLSDVPTRLFCASTCPVKARMEPMSNTRGQYMCCTSSMTVVVVSVKSAHWLAVSSV